MSEKPTREMILAEPAGERMDALVAQYVMGCVPRSGSWDKRGIDPSSYLPSYSSDIGCAWEVVEHAFNSRDDEDRPGINLYQAAGGRWGVKVFGSTHYFQVSAATAPLAICYAALLQQLCPAEAASSLTNESQAVLETSE